MSVSSFNTSFKQSILSVFSGGDSSINNLQKDYSFVLHANEFDYTLNYVDTLQIHKNYMTNLGDYIYVNVKIPLGDFINKIYPALTSLEMTIRVRSFVDNKEKIVKLDRFRVIVDSELLKKYRTSYVERIDKETLNTASMETIHFTLIDRTLEALRIKTTQGVITGKKPEDIIRGILLGEANKVKIEGKKALDGVDIYKPDNDDIIPQFVAGSGIKVLSVPTFIQEKLSGVYNSDIGTYIQKYKDKKYIFVYPLYKTERWDDDKGDKLVVYSLPERDLPIVEITSKFKENTLYIITTGNKQYSSNMDTDLVSDGAGFRVAKAETMMGKPVQMTEDGPVAVRDRVNFNVVTKEMDDKVNYARALPVSSVSNPMKYYSDTLKSVANNVTVEWQSADISQIYPGMPVKFYYLKDGKPVSIKGCVTGVHFSIMRNGNIYTTSQFNTTAKLSLTLGGLPNS